MAGEKFRQEAARFTEEYGFRFSIEKHLEGRAILKRSDMDTVRKGRDREALEEYYDTLSDALIAYLESKTYMADGKAYETEDISIRDFVDGFERVMQARYEDGLEEPRTTPRKPYEGAMVNAFMRSLWGDVRRFDKPLPEVWANNVLKKYDSVDRMKAVTEAADTRLATIERAEDLGENRKDLANLVMVKQAMEKVRAGRGFFWRWAPWNWSRNSEEKEYLASLTAKVEAYKNKGFPVEEVKATSSVLAGAAQRLGSIIAPPKSAAKKKAGKKADKSIDKKVDKAPAQKDAERGPSPEQMKDVKIEPGLEKKSMVLPELSENADTMQRSEQIHEASTLTKDSISIN